METFAYLHLAQDYEDPESKALVALDGLAWGLRPFSWSVGRRGAIALTSLFWTAPGWMAGVSSAAATSYGIYPVGYAPESASAASPTYLTPTSGFVSIRPDGDRPANSSRLGGCTLLPTPCTSYRPLYPAYPIAPTFPIDPDPDYRPLRPSVPLSGGVFLRRGDTGEQVRYVQDLLRSAGYFDAASTGFYATLTESGVKAFQRDQGLGVDGIVGAQTLAALEGRG